MRFTIDDIEMSKDKFYRCLEDDAEHDAEIELDRIIDARTNLIIIMGYILNAAETFKQMNPKGYKRELEKYTQEKITELKQKLELTKYVVVNGNEYELREEQNEHLQKDGIN